MRFTIRDLLWLTVVVALGMACWMDRLESNRERLRYQRKLDELAAERERTLAEHKSTLAVLTILEKQLEVQQGR